MQILKAFFLNVKQNTITLVIYMVIFCVLLLLFAEHGDTQRETTFESTQLSLMLQDEDKSTLSQGLADYLNDIHEVDTKKYTEEQIADELYYENVDYVLTIPKGFEENLLDGKTKHIVENKKRPGSTSGQFIDTQIDQYLSLVTNYLAMGYESKDACGFAKKAIAQEADINFATAQKEEGNSSIYYAFCFMPYLLVCILTVGLGGILIIFREKNLLTRLQCASLTTMQRNLQLGICSGIFALICWLTFMVVNYFFIGADVFSLQGRLSMLNSFFFLLVATSLTFLISNLTESTEVLNMVSNVVGLGLSFLGGIFVPLEVMSPAVVKFAQLLPSYWYITALETISDYTGTVAQKENLFLCMGIQLLFAVAIFCAALVVSRVKKQK